MVKCTFCMRDIAMGTGKMFVKKDGSVLNFCSNKCEKNMLKLKRNPRYLKWTKSYKKGE